MRAIDAMIVWMPNTGNWAGRPLAGKVAVTTIPQPPELRAYPMSAGACDLDWREADDHGRRELMQVYFTDMIHRYGIDEKVAREAIALIDDFAHVHFSAEKPTAEEDDNN